MSTGINFWDISIWSFIITLTILLSAMMLANFLRRVIKPLRKSLIPSSVLGGFLVLLANFVFKEITGNSMFNSITLEALTYHGLGLGFAAVALKTTDRKVVSGNKGDILNYGLTTVAVYVLQGFVGIIALLIIGSFISGTFPAAGLLLPMGYGQGPGQAYNWGHTYEVLWGFENGTSFGLTLAATGFISASLGGIFYLERLKKKGLVKSSFENEVVASEEDDENKPARGEIPLSESMDKLTVQIALVLIAYAFAYIFMWSINKFIETGTLGSFGTNTLQPLLWGFNFLISTVFAVLVKTVMRFLKKKRIMRREYTSNFMQNRISGFAFDIMVVASIAAIKLSAFKVHTFIVPIIILSIVGGVGTYFFCHITSKTLYKGYEHESFLVLYGTLTGTASTGIILLREIDPQFKTPAATNIVYQQLYAILFGFPVLLLLGFAPQSTANLWITLIILTVLLFAYSLLLFRSVIFKKKKKLA
ncbi:MAG: sodium/glutamate symporter [Clostridia bacterium]|jgi:ESS family glutamate:Na+ symporter